MNIAEAKEAYKKEVAYWETIGKESAELVGYILERIKVAIKNRETNFKYVTIIDPDKVTNIQEEIKRQVTEKLKALGYTVLWSLVTDKEELTNYDGDFIGFVYGEKEAITVSGWAD